MRKTDERDSIPTSKEIDIKEKKKGPKDHELLNIRTDDYKSAVKESIIDLGTINQPGV